MTMVSPSTATTRADSNAPALSTPIPTTAPGW